ncbi:hypothetical protein GCM10029963_26650 [Micromonospora andamanensis]
MSSTGYNDRGLEAYQAGPAYVTGQPGTGLLELNPGADRVRTVFSHDAVGRVINEGLWSGDSQLWATVTGYGGNPDGWQVTVTPPLGGTATATISDVHDRTIELRQFHGRTPTGGFDTTTYSYTPRDDLKTVTGPTGKVWQYEYDLRGRERRTTDPDKGVTTLTYDNSDDVTSSTDARGEVVSTEYDLLGRQYKRLVNGQLAAEWTYDTVAKGHLTKQLSIVDGYHFTRQIFDYNDAYQVRDEESVVPAMPGLAGAAGTYVSTFTFKVDGSPERVNMPRVGGLEREMLNHTYDDLGNVTRLVGTSSPSGAVNVYVDDATYSPYGELLQRKLGVNNKPQAYQTYVYDDVTRRLAEFYFDRDASITNVAALNYKYDPAGNVLSMANRPQDNDGNARPGDSDVQCFQYDQLRRLTQAWTQSTNTCAANPQSSDVGGVSPYWKSYAYDKAGSRESVTDKRTGVTSTYGYAASGGQPHAVRTVTTGERVDHYDWDAIGNLTYRRVGGVTETLDWNAQGKLSEITGPDGTTRMHYDVDGNRIARIDPNGDATVFVAGHELTVSGQNKTATRYYEHAGGVIASRSGSSASGSGDVFWLGSDHQGSTRWVVNAVTRVDTIKYADPHGNVRGAAGGPWPSGQRGFVGGTDDPTGLTLLGARFYDSTLGAFISVDPLQDLADPQQWNGYSYSNNNPVTWSDPSGLIYSDFIDAVNQDAAQGNGKASQRGLCLDGSAWACSQKYQQNRSYAKSRIAKGPGPSAKKQMAGALLCTAIVLCRIAETAYTATRAYKSCIAGASAECGGYAMDLASMGHGSSLRRLLRNTCRHSFDPETLVLMSDGSKKPIGLIEEGDEVVAHDPETGDTAAASIEAIHVNPDSDLTDLTIRTADGRSIVLETTHHHPFWSESRQGWVDAAYLWPGEQLGTRHGHAEVVKVLNYSGNETMRDLTVANIHTYYVLAGNTPVLVHNTGPGGCIPGYENPGHHDPRGGPNPYNPNKGVLPADAEAQFQNSVLVEGTRWTKIGSGKKAIYYRYSNDEHGNWHWSGSSNGVDNRGNPVEIPLNHIPIQVRRR